MQEPHSDDDGFILNDDPLVTDDWCYCKCHRMDLRGSFLKREVKVRRVDEYAAFLACPRCQGWHAVAILPPPPNPLIPPDLAIPNPLLLPLPPPWTPPQPDANDDDGN